MKTSEIEYNWRSLRASCCIRKWLRADRLTTAANIRADDAVWRLKGVNMTHIHMRLSQPAPSPAASAAPLTKLTHTLTHTHTHLQLLPYWHPVSTQPEPSATQVIGEITVDESGGRRSACSWHLCLNVIHSFFSLCNTNKHTSMLSTFLCYEQTKHGESSKKTYYTTELCSFFQTSTDNKLGSKQIRQLQVEQTEGQRCFLQRTENQLWL